MNDLVSIVLPVYNGEKYLRESIESVLAQTYINWELIVIDDCSTDSTPEIVQEYAENDSRIKYYRNEENLKLPRSLNRGFKLTKGDYLTWTSDDNRFRCDAIEYLLSEIKNENCDFVFTAFCRIDEKGNKIEDVISNPDIVKMIPVRNVVGPSFMYTSKVYQTIGDYDDSLFLTEDFDYWQRIYGRFGVAYSSKVVYEYRIHRGALTETRTDEAFYRSLCKTLEKNRILFGDFCFSQNYCFYTTLSKGKEILNENNPYRFKAGYYSFLNYLFNVLPHKVKKLLKRNA